MGTDAHMITVSRAQVQVVRKDIRNLHLGVYPPTTPELHVQQDLDAKDRERVLQRWYRERLRTLPSRL